MSQAGEFAYIYEDGPFDVELIDTSKTFQKPGRLKKSAEASSLADKSMPPKPLLLAIPKESGSFPVVMLQHGFVLKNSFYSQLMQHISSHGSIVIAPQMYEFSGADAAAEISDAAALINWLPEGLPPLLGESKRVKPDFRKLALLGHSRGGKVAFALALGFAKTTLKISALVGLDPVDGTSNQIQTKPRVLRFLPHSFNFDFPCLVVGAGLGCVKKNLLFPPCAPERVSHRAFFNDCRSPAFHFVAPDYGHMDYLDDQTEGSRGKLTYCACKNGPSRAPMRRFAGGIVVAFLLGVFDRKFDAFHAAFKNISPAPVKLDPPECHGSLNNFLEISNSTKL